MAKVNHHKIIKKNLNKFKYHLNISTDVYKRQPIHVSFIIDFKYEQALHTLSLCLGPKFLDTIGIRIVNFYSNLKNKVN